MISIEHLRQYFNKIATLYILEDDLTSEISDLFMDICPRFTQLPLSKFLARKEPLSFHFVVIELSTASKELLEAIFAKFVSVETIILCDNKNDSAVVDAAVHHKVSGILGRNPDSRELGEKLRLTLLSLSSKQKTKAKNDNYAKLAEYGGIFFCIKKAGNIVFANSNLLSYCKVATIAELNSLEAKKGDILEAVRKAGDEERSVFVTTNDGDSYLVSVKNLQNEQIVSCAKAPQDTDKHSGALSHTDFIELLKNTLIHRNASEEPVYVVTVKLENAQKIIDNSGSEFFYDYFKRFGSFCGFFFEKEPFIFWYFDYIVILPERNDVEFIRASVAELFTQSRQFWHGKGVTPFVDVSLLDLTHLSINESISLIEKIHAKTQTQAQNAKVCLNLSSSNTSTSHGQMAMYHLQNIADKDHKLKLLNIYKGLSVASAGKVEKIVDGDIYVQTEKLQKYLMHTEKNVVIQSDYIPMDIAAEVKYVDSEQPYAILKNPVFLESSANNRKTVRVQCSTKIAIMITGSKYAFAGEIFDLSMQAIAVRYKNKINDDIVGTDAKLSFSLPNKASEDKINRVALAGQVTAVKELDEETRVIIAVKMDPQNEKIVLEYIYSRQKELIVEIKKLGSMIFK